MNEEKEEIRSINGKVFAFGLTAITLLVVVICGCLLLALYSMSCHYLDQVKIAQDRQETIYTLRRALDRDEGKLYVYEAFLTDKQEQVVHKMITRYIRKEGIKSNEVTLNDFEKWMGIGG
jgi:DNA-binding transcriptional regulator of glucitol operon